MLTTNAISVIWGRVMGDSYPKFKVAAVQAAPVFMDREATVDKACALIEEAGENGARVIGFPENFISGYPYWYNTKLDNPLLDQGKFFKELYKNAVEVSSEATSRLCQAARKSRAYLVVGINERDRVSMGTVYNSQLIIDDRGRILGVRRKLAPTLAEKLVYSRGDGSGLKVFKTEYGQLGALICGEHANSLAKFALIAKGETLHVASWPAFPKDLWSPLQNETVLFRVRQHAHEGKLFLISSCGHFSQEMKDKLCSTDAEKARVSLGGGCSAIIGPRGQYLAGPLYDEEGIIYAEVDLEEIIEGKMHHDLLGHYSRFDVLSLNLNEEKLTPLKIYRGPDGLGRDEETADALEELRTKLSQLDDRFRQLVRQKSELTISSD